ncbi:MAG: biliverdin-producing heme oxygenase [Myxococcota bacterium]
MNLSHRLKTETESLHRLAERHEMQRDLMRGRLDRPRYRRFLEQLYFFHTGLDIAWSALAVSKRMVFPTPGTLRHALLADLQQMGSMPDAISIGPSASQYITELLEADTAAVVGARYVFEGACNGGVFIARAMEKGYGRDCPPHQHLLPYGDSQRQVWMGFRSGLDRLRLTDAENEAVVEGAQRTFRSFILLMEEVVGFDALFRRSPVAMEGMNYGV